jgi:Domain of unknown function (DUF1835)
MNDELVLLSKDREILHIVSGHSVEGTLRASDIPSDNVVVWYDLPTIGPVCGKTLEETTRIRNRYFRNRVESHPLKDKAYLPSYTQRNRILRSCGQWREVVLWFGPSVMEQFSLLQILAAIAEQGLRRTRLTLVTCPKHALGVYRPEEMSGFFKSHVAISRQQIALAKRAWKLYCGSDPIPLFRFARTHSQSAPVLCNALLRQLERYPSVHNGLSLSEEALLREVEVRGTLLRAVGHVLGIDDEYRTGDGELFDLLLEFLVCEAPLIEPVEKGRKIKSFLEFRRLEVKLSTAGSKILAGQLDNVTLNGLNRWIGGVHLKGKKAPWRWNSEKQLLKSY